MGVGDADFRSMEVLDGDYGALRSDATGRVAQVRSARPEPPFTGAESWPTDSVTPC